MQAGSLPAPRRTTEARTVAGLKGCCVTGALAAGAPPHVVLPRVQLVACLIGGRRANARGPARTPRLHPEEHALGVFLRYRQDLYAITLKRFERRVRDRPRDLAKAVRRAVLIGRKGRSDLLGRTGASLPGSSIGAAWLVAAGSRHPSDPHASRQRFTFTTVALACILSHSLPFTSMLACASKPSAAGGS